MKRTVSARVSHALRWITAGGGAGLFALGASCDLLRLGTPGLSGDQFALMSVGSAFIVAAAAGRLLSPSILLFFTSLSLSSLGLVIAAMIHGVNLPSGLWKHNVWLGGGTNGPLYQQDTVYGYKPIPGATAKATAYHLAVTYSIDRSGWRKTPRVQAPVGRVTIAGCSQTFGLGVEDDRNYPAVLAAKYWPDLQMKNMSAPGWGTTQAYLALLDEIRSENPPDVFVYAWIGDHQYRNYFNERWVNFLNTSFGELRVPHFEIEQGKLVHKGLGGRELSRESTSALTRYECELTLKLVEEMAGAANRAGIDFLVLALPNENEVIDWRYLTAFLRDRKIPTIDLSKTKIEFFSHDPHPTAAGHAKIAAAIARDRKMVHAVDEVRRKNKARKDRGEH